MNAPWNFVGHNLLVFLYALVEFVIVVYAFGASFCAFHHEMRVLAIFVIPFLALKIGFMVLTMMSACRKLRGQRLRFLFVGNGIWTRTASCVFGPGTLCDYCSYIEGHQFATLMAKLRILDFP